jgi:RND family efflux transporter MFP subunit
MLVVHPYHRAIRLVPITGLLWLVSGLHVASAREIDGFTEPYRDIDVAAPEMGQIDRLAVREGDRVKAGQVLARLDDEVWKASLEVARAAMESAGRVEAAEAELRLCQETLVKLTALHERDHATQQEVDRALAQRDVAEARVKAAQEELLVKAREYERADVQLKQRSVLSPVDGIVTQIYKDEGEFVSPSDAVVIRVVQLDPLLIVFSVPVTDLDNLAVNTKVQVRVDAVDKPVEGTVEFVSPTTDAQSGTTRVRVKIANPGEAIRSGANCHLMLSDSPATIINFAPR